MADTPELCGERDEEMQGIRFCQLTEGHEGDHDWSVPPPSPFSDSTEVTIEWETSARCYVQIDGHDVVVLDFIRDSSTVNVQVWGRLHGKTPRVAATVDVKFRD